MATIECEKKCTCTCSMRRKLKHEELDCSETSSGSEYSSDKSSAEYSSDEFTDDFTDSNDYNGKISQRKSCGRKKNKPDICRELNSSLTNKKKKTQRRKKCVSTCNCSDCDISSEDCYEYALRKNSRSKTNKEKR